MFSRNVSIRLKPNTLHNFKQTFEKEVIPMLLKQPGFRPGRNHSCRRKRHRCDRDQPLGVQGAS